MDGRVIQMRTGEDPCQQAEESDSPHRFQSEYVEQAIGGVRIGRQIHTAADVTSIGGCDQQRRSLPGSGIGGEAISIRRKTG
jgi:hypothetical protein